MYERELEVAITAARSAGTAVKRWYDGTVTVQAKANKSPLTEADVEANQIIEEAITTAFPDDGWLSEESVDSAERLKKQRVWIVDPLDGTQEFVNRIPEFVVCIGLADEGKAVVGVEYNPVSDELFAGAKGLGVTFNGAVVRTTDVSQLRQARVLASRSETKRGEWSEFENEMRVELTGSVAYKLGLIAAGRADATFSLTPKNEWDVCAGTALILAAGGRTTDRYGKPLRFNQRDTKLPGMIACGPNLFGPIVALLRQRGKME
jgi:myo-inositol-1(or 4)-monophosphatase